MVCCACADRLEDLLSSEGECVAAWNLRKNILPKELKADKFKPKSVQFSSTPTWFDQALKFSILIMTCI
jgi:hypothetical protein